MAIAFLLATLTYTETQAAQESDGQGNGSISVRSLVTYTVQPGDTFLAIAQRFSTSPATIIEANGISSAYSLVAGQTLVIPIDTVIPQVSTAQGAQRPSAGVPGVPRALLPAEAMTPTSPLHTSALGSSAQPAVGVPTGSSAALRRPAQSPNMTMGAPLSNSLNTPPGAPLPSVASRAPERSVPATTHSIAAHVALEYSGAPYAYGGAGPSGFDCSGFAQFVMRKTGREIPRDLFGQYNAGSHPESLEPGDLVFFRDTYESGLSHVGIYLGNGQFIHAISEGRGVGTSNLAEAYYAERWYGATRLP
jgi:peptidoglycan endopeptidase LytE